MQSRRQRSRIEKLRLDSLRVPPAGKAQRAFREAKSDRIAAEFDINSFGIPAVCRVNGTNWVVDGQHRVSAIQKCGYAKASDTIECEVYEGLSIAEMARMFLGRNRSTPVTPFERFAVAVTAGYPTEVAITKIVESLGLKVGYPKTDVLALVPGCRNRSGIASDANGGCTTVGTYRTYHPKQLAQPLSPGVHCLPQAISRFECGLWVVVDRSLLAPSARTVFHHESCQSGI